MKQMPAPMNVSISVVKDRQLMLAASPKRAATSMKNAKASKDAAI
ncbi:MAG: hypothetical protein N3G22_02725 [Candidatus Micrarchaeota archaeon]|nr:hypothetical protein [Candidatus Micrarchaeota archaeon]